MDSFEAFDPRTRAVSTGQPAPVGRLAGEDAPLPGTGWFATVEGLLRAPANVMHEVRHRPRMHARLALLAGIAIAASGVVVGSFAGGLQLVIVPLKLGAGALFCALICAPSLHILASLSGARHDLRVTTGALLAGVALTALLLVGFAPIAWLFSQSTHSAALVGGLHVFFLLVSAQLGLRLTRRALADEQGRVPPALGLWSVVFVLVMLQMTTTLRPLVGPFDGFAFAPRAFFLADWWS